MIRLIKSEFQKLLKGKFIRLFILISILVSIGICYKVYYGSDNYKDVGYNLTNLEGKQLSDLEFCKAKDAVMHSYSGEWSQAKQKQIIQDLKNELKKYPRDQIDEKAMTKAYGKNWKYYLEKQKKTGLSQKDIQEITNEIGQSPEYLTQEDDTIELETIYTNDSKREYLSELYTHNKHIHQSIDNNIDTSHLISSEWNAYLLNPQLKNVWEVNYLASTLTQNEKLTKEETTTFQKYLMSEVESLPHQFESGLPNQFMLRALSMVYILPIFVIMIALANIFAIEREYQMDQIIYPTQSNRHRITIAKLITGYLFSIGLIILQLIIVYLFGSLAFPIHGWNFLVTSIDFFSVIPIIPTTYLTLLIYAIVLPLFGAIAMATLSMGLSYVLKKKFIVIIPLFILVIVGMFCQMIYIPSFMKTFFEFCLPINMIQFYNYFLENNILGIGSPYIISEAFVIPMRWIVIGLWGFITILVINIIYKQSYKQYIRY